MPCSSYAPAGGALVAAPRHSTKTRAADMISGSISGPNVPPTELTCVPALSHSRRTTGDRKSTRLNSSHGSISYAVFCLKKKTLGHIDGHFPHHVGGGLRQGYHEVCWVLREHQSGVA